MRYQKESVLAPAGRVKVCTIELSPLVGLVLPFRAAKAPECGVVTTDVVPVLVQGETDPLSKPPFEMD